MLKLKVDTSGSIQIKAKTWYRLESPGAEECCDCGLVHVTEYQLYNGMLMFRTRRDERATLAARKRHGIRIAKAK